MAPHSPSTIKITSQRPPFYLCADHGAGASKHSVNSGAGSYYTADVGGTNNGKHSTNIYVAEDQISPLQGSSGGAGVGGTGFSPLSVDVMKRSTPPKPFASRVHEPPPSLQAFLRPSLGAPTPVSAAGAARQGGGDANGTANGGLEGVPGGEGGSGGGPNHRDHEQRRRRNSLSSRSRNPYSVADNDVLAPAQTVSINTIVTPLGRASMSTATTNMEHAGQGVSGQGVLGQGPRQQQGQGASPTASNRPTGSDACVRRGGSPGHPASGLTSPSVSIVMDD